MENMIAKMKAICGVAPEITIRGEKKFTFSFENVERVAAAKLSKFFSDYVVSVDHDEECGTCVYVDA